MPQLNILISDDLMASLNAEAEKLGIKKAKLVKMKLGGNVGFVKTAKVELLTKLKPDPYSTAGHLKEEWVDPAENIPLPGDSPTIGADAVKLRADVPYENEETVMPTPAQLSGKTGMPIATCVRLLASKRVFVDGGHVLVDGEPV